MGNWIVTGSTYHLQGALGFLTARNARGSNAPDVTAVTTEFGGGLAATPAYGDVPDNSCLETGCVPLAMLVSQLHPCKEMFRF